MPILLDGTIDGILLCPHEDWQVVPGDPSGSLYWHYMVRPAPTLVGLWLHMQFDGVIRGAWAIFPGAQPTVQPWRDPGGG